MMCRPILAVSILMTAGMQTAFAELTAVECAILYNKNSDASEKIARHYARVRGVPEDQLLGLGIPYREQISRDRYERQVANKVRTWLRGHKHGDRIRCLVTCYDLPLKVASKRATDAEKAAAAGLEKKFAETRVRIVDLIRRVRAKGDELDDRRRVWRDIEKDASIPELYELFLDGQKVVVSGGDDAGQDELVTRRRAALGFIFAAEGRTGIVARGSGAAEQLGYATTQGMQDVQDRAVALEQRIGPAIAYGSATEAFDAALTDVRESRGLFGLARVLRDRMLGLTGRDSRSALDSELALVMWEPYSPAGWTLNPLQGRLGDAMKAGPFERVLMVSRLDAPTPELVHRMIDTSVAVEAKGLRGNVYLDARGLRRNDGYVDYDRNLITLADMLRKETELSVTLDRRSKVFQAGDCPETALYCGWYNVKSYVDAFDFVPGAVAVHIASFELVSLREKGKKYWCKELLKDGVAATFGAVNEPYLEAFPKPTAFFGLLISGEFTLAEAFFATQPFISWQMALIGDPLYRPFKMNPQASVRLNTSRN